MVKLKGGGVSHEKLINAVDKLKEDGTLLAGECLPVAGCVVIISTNNLFY